MPNCRECLHDEMCFSTHTGDSPACCDFLDAARYHEIMQAEREGRLVILHRKPHYKLYSGEEIYIIDDCEIWEDYVANVIVGESVHDRNKADVLYETGDGFSFIEAAFGKTVFLSREAAEKALEEANGKNH